MSNDYPQNAVKNLVWDASHWVRIGYPDWGGTCYVHVIVWTKGWTCHVLVYVITWTEGWMCHMSNGGVPCETATCTLRGWSLHPCQLFSGKRCCGCSPFLAPFRTLRATWGNRRFYQSAIWIWPHPQSNIGKKVTQQDGVQKFFSK